MGYVQSATTVTLRARLTQKGREELLSGTTQLTVKYFALGDGDANYRTTSILTAGKVPDVTGDYSGCTLSLADGVGLHYPIGVDGNTQPADIIPPATTATTSQLIFAAGSPSSIDFSANTLTCEVFVNRLMNAENKILYDWYSNAVSADNVAFNMGIGGLTPKQSIPGQPTNPIQFSGTNNGTVVVLGGEPYANFYDFICVNTRHESNGVVTHTQEYDDIDFEFANPEDRYLWELVNNIMIYKNDTKYDYSTDSSYGVDYTNFIRGDQEKTVDTAFLTRNTLPQLLQEFPTNQLEVSPMVTSFSSLGVSKLPTSATKDSNTYSSTDIVGAGPGGLLVSAREYGYYAEYSPNKLMRGFLPTSLVENNYKSLFSDSANIDNIYPAVRIKPDTSVNTGMRAGIQNGNVMGTKGAAEFVFIYDAFSGYPNDDSNNVKPKFTKFYDGEGLRGEFGVGRNNIYTMDKLKFDPFNPQFENTNGRRGFANSTYTPSEYELSQMSAFDHIITQGRLLRLTVDPYVDYQYDGTGGNVVTSGNVGFGLVGNGGISPDNKFYGTLVNDGKYTPGDAIGENGGVEASKDFTFNTSVNQISFLKALTNNTSEYWHASLQKTGFGGGLTLLNYERYMLDGFFNMTYESLAGNSASGQAWEGRFVKNITKDASSREVTINIKMIAKTKNIKNDNGTPYSGELNLIFRNTPIASDSGTAEIPTGAKGWGYKDNISPIIVRKS